ncbi:hypothetical protein AB1K70_08650 [Bremerella sp. JC770]|uniref:hypothetical protein n=1 Tax=Bremerella sp. JC770 TaxID=3232137 RepID=UPI00345AD0D9
MTQFFVLASFLAVFCSQAFAEEPLLDAAAALQKSFETREKLVKGSCTITGVNHLRDVYRDGPGPDTELKLVFDFSVPVFRIAEHGTGIYLRTPDYQYHTYGNRHVINRMPLDQHLVRDPYPFHVHTLGFYSRPNARLRDTSFLDFEKMRDRLLASEFLEAKMEDGLLRIRFERPRVEGDHYAVQYQMWLDPDKGYLPERIEEFGADKQKLLVHSDLDWKLVSDTWVPASFKQTLRKRSSYQIRWSFDWHSVNENIPDARFELNTFPLSGETIELRDRDPSGRTTKVGTVQGI